MHHVAFPGIDHDLQQVVSQFLCVPPWKVDHQRAIAEHEAKMRYQEQVDRANAKANAKAVKAIVHQNRQAEKAAEAADRKAKRIADHEARNAALAAGGKKARKARKKKKEDPASVTDSQLGLPLATVEEALAVLRERAEPKGTRVPVFFEDPDPDPSNGEDDADWPIFHE
jgi:hypothetical protein